ncbi:MAG: SRPBCC family protein [Thermomonas sp.]|uniref:SRPBCC family protein n=1 Tax=Thermomonas sp. TaxID=1971895 RepID=UPI001D97BAC5|nr:SRPBCC family protein [Thermomonas sp.]MBZ0087400.1 SRPBCC family protein [Thermomonas sp.]MCO5054713.1 SRPBCC family protein [Thermomonas sp.]
MQREPEFSASAGNPTAVARKSDCELVVTRTFNAPLHIVFDAWSKPELFQRWWVPASAGLRLISCEMDIRTGGRYRLVFQHPIFEQPMAFFGSYVEVTPNLRLVWTNEESDQGAVTTVSFEADGEQTRVTLHERYPSKEALDQALAGSAEALPEQFKQLDALLAG